MCSECGVEITEDHGVPDTAQHADKQPRESCRRLAEYIVMCLDVLRQTRCQLVVTFGLFTDFIHYVIDRNASHQTSDTVNNRNGNQVVLFNDLNHFIQRGVYMNR